MSGRSGILRIWLRTGQLMLRHAAHRESSWWILAGGLLTALLLSGFTSFVQAVPSALVWTIPWALLTGWPSSGVRTGLSAQLELTWAGSGSTKPAEIVLPALLATAPAILFCYVTGLYRVMFVPWQTYVIVPFQALLASSVLLLVETRYVHRGRALLVLLYALQFIQSPGTGIGGLMVVPGYALFSLQWGNGLETVVHGDTWMALAVFTGLAAAYLSGRFSK